VGRVYLRLHLAEKSGRVKNILANEEAANGVAPIHPTIILSATPVITWPNMLIMTG
jgi:hypothetical protein